MNLKLPAETRQGTHSRGYKACVDDVEVPVEMFKSKVDIIDFTSIKRDGAESV
jgi:hypothetical protein